MGWDGVVEFVLGTSYECKTMSGQNKEREEGDRGKKGRETQKKKGK